MCSHILVYYNVMMQVIALTWTSIMNRLSKPITFSPHGELLHVYQHQDQTYEVYKVQFESSWYLVFMLDW